MNNITGSLVAGAGLSFCFSHGTRRATIAAAAFAGCGMWLLARTDE